jgi:hypothetical protein
MCCLLIRYLRDSLHFIDARRVAVWGRAHGGFLAALALASPLNVFHCGIAITPIVRWRYYGTYIYIHTYYSRFIFFLTTDWRNDPNTRLLRSRVRFPHSTNICVYEHLYLYWVWAFSMNGMYVFTKKKYISMYIYPLSRIHNTSLASAYFGLDKRECV